MIQITFKMVSGEIFVLLANHEIIDETLRIIEKGKIIASKEGKIVRIVKEWDFLDCDLINSNLIESMRATQVEYSE